jgi:hypothetical protein
MSVIVITYAVYLAISVGITVWVARTLSTNGYVFLVDVFHGDEVMAHSVNHLLVVGFYLINLGYVAIQLRMNADVFNARQGIEALADRLGTVLLGLGFMHFFNLYVFSRMRGRHLANGSTHPPVRPDARNRASQAA